MSDDELRTPSGRVLADEEIQELADEAERGYDPDKLRPLAEEERERLRRLREEKT